MNKLQEIYRKNRDVIVYIIFGVLTTAVNLITFYVIESLFGTENSYFYSNLIAWGVAVVFAYVTNKLIVFESKSWALSVVVRESAEFIGARLFSLVVEEAGLWLLIDLLSFGEFSMEILGFDVTGSFISKTILTIIVVILNYFFSKFIIFKNKK